jgi:hypothetical protein
MQCRAICSEFPCGNLRLADPVCSTPCKDVMQVMKRYAHLWAFVFGNLKDNCQILSP